MKVPVPPGPGETWPGCRGVLEQPRRCHPQLLDHLEEADRARWPWQRPRRNSSTPCHLAPLRVHPGAPGRASLAWPYLRPRRRRDRRRIVTPPLDAADRYPGNRPVRQRARGVRGQADQSLSVRTTLGRHRFPRLATADRHSRSERSAARGCRRRLDSLAARSPRRGATGPWFPPPDLPSRGRPSRGDGAGDGTDPSSSR